LKEILAIRATGAAIAEVSYYPALSNLLNEIGKTRTQDQAASKPSFQCHTFSI
jgi:hypothetical protein